MCSSEIPPRNWNMAPIEFSNAARLRGLSFRILAATYAERGALALPAYDEGSLGPAENAFEDSVAEALERRGWEVRTQVGVSGFRIDLAIVHPDRAGSYLCGIECDGAQYHSSATARDRDKIRQAVLEGLGWSIIRIWSTDWFRDAGTVTERVHVELEQLLAEDRKQRAADVVDVAPPVENPKGEDDAAVNSEPIAERDRDAGARSKGQQLAEVASSDGRDAAPSQVSLVGEGLALEAGRFFEASYSAVLGKLILSIAQAEGPMPIQGLARRVAHEHGWQRTGKRILERVRENLGKVECHSEFDKTFVWAPGRHARRVPFRGLEDRSIQDVSRAEIASVIDDNAGEITKADDPMLVLARLLGIARLSGGARAHLRECAAWRERDAVDAGPTSANLERLGDEL